MIEDEKDTLGFVGFIYGCESESGWIMWMQNPSHFGGVFSEAVHHTVVCLSAADEVENCRWEGGLWFFSLSPFASILNNH